MISLQLKISLTGIKNNRLLSIPSYMYPSNNNKNIQNVKPTNLIPGTMNTNVAPPVLIPPPMPVPQMYEGSLPANFVSSSNVAPSYPVQQVQQTMNYQSNLVYQNNFSNNYNPFANNIYLGGNNVDKGITLLHTKEDDKNKKVVAVIVSFVTGMSYDNLFTTIEQKSLEGTRVLVYSCGSQVIKTILKQYKNGNSENETAKELIGHIKSLDPDCVVFNWECSSGYSGQIFPEGKADLFDFVKFVIDKGHMAMFSDFSLKSLINEWDAAKLGPNPFKKIGQTSNPFELHFESKTLTQCPSAQLQTVGEMADGGKCHVEAMGGTIVYSANNHIKQNQFYKLQILTVAETDCGCPEADYKLTINGKTGAAGHILLTYKSGGHLLTSMGHWVELMKIDTSEKKLFEVAEKQYGAEVAQKMKSQYAQMNVAQQKNYISKNAVNFVQSQAPCSNMMTKGMYKKM